MTQIAITGSDGAHWRVEAKGHAGDERICAAISTACGAALNVLGDAAQNIRYESGDVEFDVHLTEDAQVGALEMLAETFFMLADKFPAYVGVTFLEPTAL